VKRAEISGGPYTNVATTTGTSFTNTGLTNGKTYYFVVSASNLGSESPNSSEAGVTPNPPPPPLVPPAPSALTASAAKGKINLRWTQPSGAGITKNRIYRAVSGPPFTVLATTTGPVTSFTDTSVTAGTTYYYRVTSLNASQESGYSNVASATGR
jgi:cellulose 1,4-beta-cellobiosidase